MDQSLGPESTTIHKPHHLGMSIAWQIMDNDSYIKYNSSVQSFVKNGCFISRVQSFL